VSFSRHRIEAANGAHDVALPKGHYASVTSTEGTMKTTTSDEFTLAETIDHLHRRGFTGHFGVIADGLREFGTGATFRADEVRICDCFRLEEAPDPSDIAVVYAIESRTGVRGTLVDAFGVYSNPAISEFVARVAIGRTPVSRDRARAA
jgi:hypothetical protein